MEIKVAVKNVECGPSSRNRRGQSRPTSIAFPFSSKAIPPDAAPGRMGATHQLFVHGNTGVRGSARLQRIERPKPTQHSVKELLTTESRPTNAAVPNRDRFLVEGPSKARSRCSVTFENERSSNHRPRNVASILFFFTKCPSVSPPVEGWRSGAQTPAHGPAVRTNRKSVPKWEGPGPRI